MKEQKVFISHSTEDAEWARSFAQALIKRGVTVWLDEFDVPAGGSGRDALEAGLRNSDVVVALLNPGSLAKHNLFFELGAAIGMGKRVVSIVPKEIEAGASALELRLRRNFIRDTPEQTAEDVSNSLQAA